MCHVVFTATYKFNFQKNSMTQATFAAKKEPGNAYFERQITLKTAIHPSVRAPVNRSMYPFHRQKLK
jgi:hypothetical protein